MIHNEGGARLQSAVDGALDRLFDVAVVLGDLMDRQLAEDRLTPARAELIWLLQQDGPRTQRELSQRLKCTPRNVTGLVDALQEAGFVTRNPHPTDRRATLVTLTDQGEAVAADWRARRGQGAGGLFAGIPAADLETVNSVLDLVLGRLRAADPAR